MPVIAKFVVVACDVVAFCAVKFWRVLEPETSRLLAVKPALNAIAVEVAFDGNGYAKRLAEVR